MGGLTRVLRFLRQQAHNWGTQVLGGFYHHSGGDPESCVGPQASEGGGGACAQSLGRGAASVRCHPHLLPKGRTEAFPSGLSLIPPACSFS